MENPKKGFFLLGMLPEKGMDDRILICITPENQQSKLPVIYFEGFLSSIFSKLRNRTSYNWPIVKDEWSNAIVQRQTLNLKNPPKQLWDITKDKLPQNLQEAYENGDLDISELIRSAYKNGYQVYLSNQGSILRGPLPIPGWRDASD